VRQVHHEPDLANVAVVFKNHDLWVWERGGFEVDVFKIRRVVTEVDEGVIQDIVWGFVNYFGDVMYYEIFEFTCVAVIGLMRYGRVFLGWSNSLLLRF